MVTATITFLLVLGALILFHEFGHFSVARLCGVGVQTFSLGFGPKLLTKKWGETEYCLCAFPLGGYVRMVGDDPAEEVAPQDKERSFPAATLPKKIAIVVAGPFFNFILAFLVFWGLFMTGVPLLTPDVGEVAEGSAAAIGGMQPGDKILSINEKPITQWEEIRETLQEGNGSALRFSVLRAGAEQGLTITPMKKEVKDIFGDSKPVFIIGVMPTKTQFIKRYNPVHAFGLGLARTGQMIGLNTVGIFKLIEGKISSDNIGGPILIAKMAADQAEQGLLSILLFSAMISINLGVINLFPVPVLDGGHLLFFLIEAVIRRPMSVKVREMASQVGLFLLVSLMVFAFYNDFVRFNIMGFFAKFFS
ncbi:MAG: RIP metalloprotease RseP [Nitrospirae bacterium]|nr:RIP metalloprotease RseP [Candidatus Troglogloeales bacterium]